MRRTKAPHVAFTEATQIKVHFAWASHRFFEPLTIIHEDPGAARDEMSDIALFGVHTQGTLIEPKDIESIESCLVKHAILLWDYEGD